MKPKIAVRGLDFYYGLKKALSDITLDIEPNNITALIGPSGCGKSTFLRCLNRMNDTIAGTRVEGRVMLDGDDIYAPASDIVELRQRVGLVFQKPNPFPQSVFDNVAFGPRVLGMHRERSLDGMVEEGLRALTGQDALLAAWDVLFQRVNESGYQGVANCIYPS